MSTATGRKWHAQCRTWHTRFCVTALGAAAFTCLSLSAPVRAAEVVVQAESFASSTIVSNPSSPGFTRVSDSLAAPTGNGQYIKTLGDSATTYPDTTATYNLNFPAAGTYTLYVRAQAEGADDATQYINDSFYVGQTFGTNPTFGPALNRFNQTTPEPAQYRWVNLYTGQGLEGGVILGTAPQYTVTASGPRTFVIGGRENGLRFDAFVFSTNNALTKATLDSLASVPGKYLRGVNSYTLAYSSINKAYPTEPPSSYTYLAGRGIKIIRLPFYWGDLQPTLGGTLNANYVAAINREIAGIKAAGLQVILDLHNSCRYPMYDSPAIFGNGITQAQFNDVWLRLSSLYKNETAVIAYDIMNEPYNIAASIWQPYSNGCVQALRAAGDNKLVWVEGCNYSQPASWRTNHPTPWIQDPANNTMYSAHMYFDGGGSYPLGFAYNSYPGSTGDALARLKVFTDWLQQYNVRGSIGEIGWPPSTRTSTWAQWNALGESWYQKADAANLWVTYFTAMSADDNPNGAYQYSGPPPVFPNVPGISLARTQSQVIEAHPSR